MIQGYMRVMVLNELDQSDLTGYELMKRIAAFAGKKPSPGSMYPLLNELLKEKLVTVTTEGRKKTYSISSKGKKLVQEIMDEKKCLMEAHVGFFRNMESSCSHKHDVKKIESIFKLFKEDNSVYLKNAQIVEEFKNVLIELAVNPNLVKLEKEGQQVLIEATKKLRKLSNKIK